MKYLLTLLLAGLLTTSLEAQIVQASVGVGSTSNSLKIYLKSSADINNGIVSSLQYCVAIPASITPVPTLTIVSQSISSGYFVNQVYEENGFTVYDILNAPTGYPLTFTGGVEYEAMEVRFSGGPANIPNAGLITLGTGGASGNSIFLYSGAYNSDETQLFYARPGTIVVNNPSYTGPLPSTAIISAVLPLKLGDFTVIKQNEDGYLSWKLLNQDASADHFEIERSVNGTDFTRIGTVNTTTATAADVVYNFTDPNLPALHKTIIYYRIKAVDKDGNVVYTTVKNLRMVSVNLNATLFPNPAKEFTYVSFDAASTGKGQIIVSDAAGKRISEQTFSTVEGANKQMINTSALAAGTYNIILSTPEETTKLSFVKLK